MVGIGGGIIIFAGISLFSWFLQHQAPRNNLIYVLLPIGILGVMNYHKQGYVDYKTTLIICFHFCFWKLFRK